jgi:hypothetical protein
MTLSSFPGLHLEHGIVMAVYCGRCGSLSLRPSRLRLRDAGQLLLFRYPVRCLECKRRGFVTLLEIFEIWRESQARRGRWPRK